MIAELEGLGAQGNDGGETKDEGVVGATAVGGVGDINAGSTVRYEVASVVDGFPVDLGSSLFLATIGDGFDFGLDALIGGTFAFEMRDARDVAGKIHVGLAGDFLFFVPVGELWSAPNADDGLVIIDFRGVARDGGWDGWGGWDG